MVKISLTSSLAAVELFLSRRLDFGVPLEDLSVSAIPYEEALANRKLTDVEYYTDWWSSSSIGFCGKGRESLFSNRSSLFLIISGIAAET